MIPYIMHLTFKTELLEFTIDDQNMFNTKNSIIFESFQLSINTLFWIYNPIFIVVFTTNLWESMAIS